jgi:hypothetical protein
MVGAIQITDDTPRETILKLLDTYRDSNGQLMRQLQTALREHPLTQPQQLASDKASFVIVPDGNAWMAVGSNFTNLQESDAGFGDNPLDALADLYAQDDADLAMTTPVLDHGFVTLRNIAGPTRRRGALFDADDVDPANSARMSFGKTDTPRRSKWLKSGWK